MPAEPLASPSPSSDIWQGARLSIPVIVASSPFGLLFGAVAVDNGFTVAEATLESAVLFAGASQMVGIEMFGQRIAPWLVVFSIFAVNFRHILYSASTGRRIGHWPAWQQAVGFFFLTDPQYAEAETRAERGQAVTFAFYMGMALPLYVCWVIEGFLGAYFGRLIPDARAIGIDFLLPIYFLGLVMGFRSRPLWLPVVIASSIASIVAHKTIGSPWHVSVGAVAGIILAAAIPLKSLGAQP